MPEDGGDEDRARAIAEETRRARILRMVVDLTANILVQGRLTRSEAEDLVAAARHRALELFPGKEGTYELILAPRFARLMDEFTAPDPPASKVLRFRKG
jgi:hypothetical protein